MKRHTHLASALVPLALCFLLISTAQAQSFQVTNETGFTITQLFVIPGGDDANDEDYEQELLQGKVIAHGQSATLNFNTYRKSPVMDLWIRWKGFENPAEHHHDSDFAGLKITDSDSYVLLLEKDPSRAPSCPTSCEHPARSSKLVLRKQ